VLETLVTIHSWVRWLVLTGLITGAVFGFMRYRATAVWKPYVLQAEVMIVDIQAAIGASIWIFFDGWRRGSFFAVLHPGMMLTALATLHIASVVAARRADNRSWLIMLGSSLAALVLIVAAIPWDRL
jgi:hypothetical protein